MKDELYLSRADVRALLISQPDENLDITEAILFDIDQLQVHTAEGIRSDAPPVPTWHEDAAQWIEHKADVSTNSLHCGDNSMTISLTHKYARTLRALAEEIRDEAPPVRSAASTVEPAPGDTLMGERLHYLAKYHAGDDGLRFLRKLWEAGFRLTDEPAVAPTTSPEPDNKGFFSSLSPEQQKQALSYRGEETHGSPEPDAVREALVEVKNWDEMAGPLGEGLHPRIREIVLAALSAPVAGEALTSHNGGDRG